ncbi:MAG: tocopherol cyclase family protein [Bacteroidota bacterium]
MVRSKRIKSIFNPEMYHGWGQSKSYFEGWYFKQVDPSGTAPIAVIPGISYEDDGSAHSFIQVLDGKNRETHYHRFPAEAFQPHEEHFELTMGDNYFSPERMVLKLPGLQGQIHLQGQVSWPSKWYSPGVMGWYTFVPLMQCYHGVVSMDHQLQGQLVINNETIDYTGGKGYIEKDWGRSFPSSWFWMQSNNFESDRSISLMASVAKIPWLGSSFIGFLAGFLLDDTLFRFTTYTGAKLIHKKLEREHLELAFQQKQHQLAIIAHKGNTEELVAPTNVGMTGKVDESMSARLSVQFKEGGKLLYEGDGIAAGLEIGGNYSELL